MYIKEIELKDFRNYEELKASFSEKVNIFLGNNAQGKTNLLESIYLNAMAKSFKSIKDRELIRFGEEFCRIKTKSFSDGEEQDTEIVISRDGKKVIKIDGVKADKSSQLLERIFIIIFSPEDLKIVKDEPEKRRKFIDRELCLIKPGYYNDLSNYKRVLKQRNIYLKEEKIESSILDIWDYELAKYGSIIISRRKEFIEKIYDISRDIHDKISGGLENISLKYETNMEFPDSYSSSEMENHFYDILRDSRSIDIKNRNTGIGPHKDDIKISADGIDLRKFGSQGQQRTAALSLKLSEIKLIEEETGEKPILLLDDVLSELDNERQSYLINSLGENQMFITTADISGKVIKSLPEGKVFKIKKGKIEMEI
ncbi:MAG: DNA replication/repair protein RecF [Anaerovoracaceae bacterium]